MSSAKVTIRDHGSLGTTPPRHAGERAAPQAQSAPAPVQAEATPTITANDYFEATGERLEDTLNLETWGPAERLMEAYARLEEEIRQATINESEMVGRIRDRIFPQIRSGPAHHDRRASIEPHSMICVACKAVCSSTDKWKLATA
jgi:hypothetical protein